MNTNKSEWQEPIDKQADSSFFQYFSRASDFCDSLGVVRECIGHKEGNVIRKQIQLKMEEEGEGRVKTAEICAVTTNKNE